jgi:hypothetical protein
MLLSTATCTTASVWYEDFSTTWGPVGSDEDDCASVDCGVKVNRSPGSPANLSGWFNKGGRDYCVAPVVEDCTTLADENCDNRAVCTGAALEIRSFGDSGMQTPWDMAVDAEGNIIVVGEYDGSIDFGAGPIVSNEIHDVFVVKLDPYGAPLWSRSFGDDSRQSAQRVAVDAEGNVLIAGHFRGSVDFGGGPLVSAGARDAFIAKLDADGNHVWSKRFGDAQDQIGRGVAADRDGNVFVAGTLWGSAKFGGGVITSAGWDDIFITKLDKDGEHLWAKAFGDQETQEAWDLAADGEGNVIMTGYSLGDVNFGAGLTKGAGMPDVILVKLSGDGSTLWSRRFGDGGMQFGQSVTVDGEGNIVMTGEVHGSIDFDDGKVHSAGAQDLFVAKLTPTGKVVWHHTVGDAWDQSNIVASIDGAGAVLLAGSFEGSIDFGGNLLVSAGMSDAFVAKLGPDGNALWSRRMGDASPQVATGIVSDLMGNVLVTGRVWGTIDLGKESVTAAAGDMTSDIFLASFEP